MAVAEEGSDGCSAEDETPSLVADATSDMAITTPFLSSTVTTRVAKIGLNVHYWPAKRLFTARRARGWSG